MATRSDIIAKLANGTWARIYCHSDGDLGHNGKILAESYTSPAKIEKLMKLGDLSSLGSEIGRKHDFDWMSKLYERCKRGLDFAAEIERHEFNPMCRAYGRDRGEKDTKATQAASLEQLLEDLNEYTYVWDGSAWNLWSDAGGRPLLDALREEGVEIDAAAPVKSTRVAATPPAPALEPHIPVSTTARNPNFGMFG